MSASQTAPSPRDLPDECAECPDGCAPHPSGLHDRSATTTHERPRALTPRMRAVLAATGIVVAVGLAAGAWLLWGAPAPPVAPTATAGPAGGPAEGAEPAAGSEVLPPADQPQQQPADRLPPLEPAAPRVGLPLPATADAQGGLVEGFPADVAAPMDGAEVIDSSVASEAAVLQFSLRSRTSASVAEVLAHYGQRWAGIGLAPAGGSEAEAAYRDDFSSVTVSAEPSGTGTIVTVYGVLRAE